MTTVVAPPPGRFDHAAAREVPPPPRPLLVVLALATVLAAVLAGLSYVNRAPGEGSVDVGFARDMSQHHAQAVAMAETVRDRTRSPEIRLLAKDIALTQQAQIGSMQAWLADWGRSPTSDAPRMAWMGAPTRGLMPGMATDAERAALATLPPDQADIRFLQLMIPHHRGALAMASHAAANADDPDVRALGRGIVAAQTAEIEYLQSLLAKRDQPPVEAAGSGSPSGGGDAAVGLGHAASGGSTSPLRDTAPLAVVALGVFALGWLAFTHLSREAPDADARWWAVVAVLGGIVAGSVHLQLTPEHARVATSFGAFFLVAGVFQLLAAAAVAAGHRRAGLAAAAAVSVLLVATWALFRVVPPPGQQAAEEVDLPGLLAVGAELAVVLGAALWWRAVGGGRRQPTDSTTG